MPFTRGPVLMYVGGGQYKTVGSTLYVGSRDVIVIPDGFCTDLATIPRIFWAFMPPTGSYERAAVLHDHGCVELANGTCALSPRDVDGLFRRVMRECGVGFVTRWVMWAGVRWGAAANPCRRPGWWRDGPLVVLITALIGAVVAGAVWAVDAAAHWLIP